MSAKKPPSTRAARSDDETRNRLTRELTAGLTMDSGNDLEVIAKIAAEYVRETEGGAR